MDKLTECRLWYADREGDLAREATIERGVDMLRTMILAWVTEL